MPSKDTKVIASRIPKSDYYKFVKVASENQMPVGTFLTAILKQFASKIEVNRTINVKDNTDIDTYLRTAEILLKSWEKDSK
jgi:hypothetical protein